MLQWWFIKVVFKTEKYIATQKDHVQDARKRFATKDIDNKRSLEKGLCNSNLGRCFFQMLQLAIVSTSSYHSFLRFNFFSVESFCNLNLLV